MKICPPDGGGAFLPAINGRGFLKGISCENSENCTVVRLAARLYNAKRIATPTMLVCELSAATGLDNAIPGFVR
jgi:hypothetical protein